MRFGKVAESICLGILRCEMHGYKDMSFYLCYKLSGTPHVFFSQTGVNGKHRHIHFGRIGVKIIQLMQEILLGSLPLRLGTLVHPMPVIQITGMKNFFSTCLKQKRYSHIRGTESTHAQCFILIFLSFFQPDGIFFLRPAMTQNVFRENIDNIRPLFTPLQYLFIKMIRMKMTGQHIQFSGSPQ